MGFRTDKPFEITIPSGVQKVATLRFPSDEEVCEYRRKQTIRRKTLGRGKSTEGQIINWVPTNAALFDKCHLGQDEFDEAEKSRFIEKLLRCELVDVHRNAQGYVVEMKVSGGQRVLHHLNMPTQKDILDRQRTTARPVEDRFGGTEQRLNVDGVEPIWQRLLISTENYDDRVPILHKDMALIHVINLMEEEADDPDPES